MPRSLIFYSETAAAGTGRCSLAVPTRSLVVREEIRRELMMDMENTWTRRMWTAGDRKGLIISMYRFSHRPSNPDLIERVAKGITLLTTTK